MTPLAHRITRAVLRGLKDPDFLEWALPALDGAHFFEVTEALPLIEEVCNAMQKSDDGPFLPCTFLPAPKTWIEWRLPDGTRHAACLIRADLGRPFIKPNVAIPPSANTQALILHLHSCADGCEYMFAGTIDLETGGASLHPGNLKRYPDAAEQIKYGVSHAVYLLAIINSPRIVGRRIHAPHKGLARELRRTPELGIGPLHDWHEIKLELNKPRDVDDGEAHADVITGKRCLHFVRKFIRLRLGRLEYVREHWRGDASVGIRRGRYVVTAGGQT